MSEEQTCPICGSTEFVPHLRHPTIKCAQCGSVERHRGTMLLLEHYCDLHAGSRIAHFAPEPWIAKRLHAICPDGYERYDYDAKKYAVDGLPPLQKCDLCTDLPSFERGVYDVVLHNHVIEHVPCNYTMVVLGLHALVKPGGVHIFSFPMTRGHFRENLTPDMTGPERLEQFMQRDHIRIFGLDDVDKTIGAIFPPLE